MGREDGESDILADMAFRIEDRRAEAVEAKTATPLPADKPPAAAP